MIDYNGMLKSLREALATYGQGDKGEQLDPLVDEAQALADYAAAIDRVEAHLVTVGKPVGPCCFTCCPNSMNTPVY